MRGKPCRCDGGRSVDSLPCRGERNDPTPCKAAFWGCARDVPFEASALLLSSFAPTDHPGEGAQPHRTEVALPPTPAGGTLANWQLTSNHPGFGTQFPTSYGWLCLAAVEIIGAAGNVFRMEPCFPFPPSFSFRTTLSAD